MVNNLLLVLCLSGVSFSHAAAQAQSKEQAQETKEKVSSLCSCLCLCLCQDPFQGKIRITVFALVLTSLVKTRLLPIPLTKNRSISKEVFQNDFKTPEER